ncbi:HDOD domain-containing protein [Gammaproteobacteria bacterium]
MSTVQEFDEATTTQLLKGIDIPPQPQILRVVMEEQRRPNPDLRKIATIVAKDVGLSAAMLRAANSPGFGLRQKVTSISQAVMLLGMGNALSLITGLSLRMVMAGKGKMKLERFWDTASDTALLCSTLARRFSIMPADQAHILGLFHDCGIPLLMQKFPNYVEVLRKGNADTQLPVTSVEEQEFKTSHTVVGYLVARSWFLSQEIREVILHHHNETLLSSSDDPVLASRVALLTLAEHITHIFHRESNDVVWQRIGSNVLRILNLNETELEDINSDMKDVLSAE